ncbi:hypothetical protein [Thiolapillus sp.]
MADTEIAQGHASRKWGTGNVFNNAHQQNHATPVREQESERRQYHDSTHSPLMVPPLFCSNAPENTMKNTIDNADYIIN